MARVVRSLGDEVATALGLHPRNIRSLTLRFGPDGSATADVEVMLFDQPEIVVVLRQYRLEPIEAEAEVRDG